MSSDQATLTLIDLHPHTSTDLFAKLKDKFRSSPLVEFSLNFTKLKTLKINTFNMLICREFNCFVTGSSDTLEIYDLITYEKLRKFGYSTGVYGIAFERPVSGQLNLVISNRSNRVQKFDFTAMLNETVKDDNGFYSMGEPIWTAERLFEHVWALKCFKSEVYVIDYASKMGVFDVKTGKEIENIQIDLNKGLVDLVFTPEDEMIVCGVDQLHLLKFNPITSCWEKMKSFVPDGETAIHRCFSLWYETKSRLIYVTDADGKIFVFDRDFKLVKKLEGLSSPYGITINEKNGQLFVCDTGPDQIIIYT